MRHLTRVKYTRKLNFKEVTGYFPSQFNNFWKQKLKMINKVNCKNSFRKDRIRYYLLISTINFLTC